MAGHSKWANIQHRKKAQDAKRGKLFTKLIREIVISARMGGPDPDANPRLRAAVDKALSGNMTRDTIERAVKRGAGDSDGDNVEELIYEGYGPGGVAVLVECMTDNRNRTVAEVRHAFGKSGGNLGAEGSVAYMFNKCGQIIYAPGVDEEQLMDLALEAGADDVIAHEDGSFEVLTSVESFGSVKDSLDASGLEAVNAEVTRLPENTSELDTASAEKLLRLVDNLDDLDDTQDVFHNAEIPEEVLEGMD
ncbi:MAG: YebC/PmpR family DNA-binding transcriptional regulator [Gammaproteobacteria bacterium]|nr:YebC/PmpR family DNA-binding transcriptional regulator [Gammaproteobacteria bacterium]